MRTLSRVTRVTTKNRAAITEAAWAFVQTKHDFSYRDICGQLHITLEAATAIVRGWESEGAVITVREGRGNAHRLWAAVKGFVRKQPPRTRSAEENLWTAMRGLGSFTPTDLAAHATTDTVQVGADKAAEYCRSLLAASYLKVIRKAQPSSHREAIYSLVRKTGPQPPTEKRVRALFDPNTQEVHVIGGAA